MRIDFTASTVSLLPYYVMQVATQTSVQSLLLIL